MIPLYHGPHFTFRFADDRIIPRFHLKGVPPGLQVSVIKIDANKDERLAEAGRDGDEVVEQKKRERQLQCDYRFATFSTGQHISCQARSSPCLSSTQPSPSQQHAAELIRRPSESWPKNAYAPAGIRL
jgi:hypothetical protein